MTNTHADTLTATDAVDAAGVDAYDTPLGITNPPIDELLERVSSKYALVIYAAKRARQINDYYNQLGDGILEYVGPWWSRVCRRSRCRSRCARSTATCSNTPKASSERRPVMAAKRIIVG